MNRRRATSGLIISRRRLPLDRPTKHQHLSSTYVSSRASRDRRETINRLCVREIGLGDASRPRTLCRRSRSTPHLNPNHRTNNNDPQPRPQPVLVKPVDMALVDRGRARLKEKQQLKQQIARDLQSIEEISRERQGLKREATLKLFDKERQERLQGLQEWKRNREEQKQRELRKLQKQRADKLKRLEKARLQRQELYAQYLKQASMRTKSQKPKPKPKPQTKPKPNPNPSAPKLPVSIFQASMNAQPKRRLGGPSGRKKPGFRSDGDIERLARDIVEKASLQNQLFRAQEQHEALSGTVANAVLSLEIPLEHAPIGSSFPESHQPLDSSVAYAGDETTSTNDAYNLSSAHGVYPQDREPHVYTPPVDADTELLVNRTAEDSLHVPAVVHRVEGNAPSASTSNTLPAVAEIERWYEEQLQQL